MDISQAGIELMQHTSDEQHTAILDKYTPKFKPLNHLSFPAKRVLGYYVRTLQKEMKDG
ncbi:hypothetical protein RN616_12785 [Morganella morganii]|uniref:hypothetical protein n=1 Tax=Morganella morganii TaxID=582 RepID=UPI0028D5C073|nr:hypothetical protein [Morganella morganii]WNP29404.1 hypothetical protein RN616_12785 [Morganella morganii]